MRFTLKEYISTLFPLFLLVMVFCSCSSDDESEVQQGILLFEDGFESSGGILNDLFPDDNSRWSNIQQVNPDSGPANDIELNSDTVRSGHYSLKIVSYPGDDILSKIDLVKEGFDARQGDKVIIEAYFYIVGDANLQNLFLIDFECVDCWDPNVTNNQNPGVRLQMSGGNDFLAFERGKIILPNISQRTLSFPRNEWVEVRWEMTLSPGEDGLTELFANDTRVISFEGINMPNASIFREEFLKYDINFDLQVPVYYQRLQIGATANDTGNIVTMFVDDVRVEIIN